MQVESYIKSLLEEEDCVIVPNFGGFISNYKNSSIQDGGVVSLLPPRKQLLFNVNLSVDDGLLIKYISGAKLISYNKAKLEVEAFVSRTLEILRETNHVEFEGLGSFKINKSKKIQFEPTFEGSPLPESFGLPVLKLSNIGVSVNNVTEHASERVLNRKKLVRRALMFSPVVLALALFPTKFYDNIQQSSFFSVVDTSIKTNIVNEEIVAAPETEIDDTQKKILSTIEDETSREKGLLYVEPINKNFHVILGSFKDEKNAILFQNNMKAQGFDCDIINKGGFYRVAAASFESKSQAYQHVISLKKRDAVFADAWVYKSL